jgi:hypothetical protein
MSIHDPSGLAVIEALAPQVSRYACAFVSRPELDYSQAAYAWLVQSKERREYES